VIGQLITSAIVGVYSGAVLAFLGVPAPAMLGVMTALLDIVPTIGVIIAITLTCLLALTVSLSATMWVAVAFAIYQALENYVLSPLIYGKRMRLSNLAVILSVAVGAKLAGIIGIILALPIAAAYPVIEQIWLKRYLGEETIEEHQAIQETPAKDLS
jgi:predicted PurR-regulated permease PerM